CYVLCSNALFVLNRLYGFFLQEEYGKQDRNVTVVQTCALQICCGNARTARVRRVRASLRRRRQRDRGEPRSTCRSPSCTWGRRRSRTPRRCCPSPTRARG